MDGDDQERDLIRDWAALESDHVLQVGKAVLKGECIYINVGARPALPKIKGLDTVPWLDSARLLDLETLPQHRRIQRLRTALNYSGLLSEDSAPHPRVPGVAPYRSKAWVHVYPDQIRSPARDRALQAGECRIVLGQGHLQL